MLVSPEERTAAEALLQFIDASPTPWHAVEQMRTRLLDEGFRELKEEDEWSLQAGEACFVTRDGSALAAFVVGRGDAAGLGCRIVGAHTDSPGLRVKPEGMHEKHGMLRLGVEIYGGPILATWTDRDLALAGRLTFRDEEAPRGIRQLLVNSGEALVRLPNLAIHLNREVNTGGLVLDKQEGLPLLLASDAGNPAERLLERLSGQAGGDRGQLLEYELCAVDVQPAAFYGLDGEFIAAGRLDNLAMCHAGLEALLLARSAMPMVTPVAVFYDNEEVGSQSPQGADGSFLPDLLERLAIGLGLNREDQLRALRHSLLISADMAHALHPNGASRYEPQHHCLLNHGPVIKQNAQLRYTTAAASAARFRRFCDTAQVPVQRYIHRTDLPCGSTIGPMAAAGLGLEAVDVGNPMFAMHSVRESAGTRDHLMMIRALAAGLRGV